MVRLLISAAIHLAANAIGLIIASLVLDDMEITAAGFVIALAIFTVVEVLLEPFFRQMAMRNAQALQGSVALVTTFVGLLVTDVVSDGLNIEGALTWVLATVIVWLGALIAALVLPVILVKRAVEDRA